MPWFAGMFGMLIPIVMMVSLFTFLGVNSWAEQRRKERESYYRYEFRKKLVDAGELNTTQMQEIMRFELEADMWRRRQGMIAGGLITAATGGGVLLGLRFIDDLPIWMVGYIPLMIGLAMLVYGFVFAQKSAPVPPSGVMPAPPERD